MLKMFSHELLQMPMSPMKAYVKSSSSERTLVSCLKKEAGVFSIPNGITEKLKCRNGVTNALFCFVLRPCLMELASSLKSILIFLWTWLCWSYIKYHLFLSLCLCLFIWFYLLAFLLWSFGFRLTKGQTSINRAVEI